MLSSRSEKIGLKRDGNYYNTMAEKFPEAKCFQTIRSDVHTEYFAPVFHAKSLVDSIASNPRPQYKLLVNRETTENELKRAVLTDPYQLQPTTSSDPSIALCLIQRGYVSPTGDVCTKYKCIQSKSCARSFGNRGLFRGYQRTKAIYVISEDQGYGFWHFMMENWVRLFAALDLLKKREDILIHVVQRQIPFVRQAISFLGIDESRVVSGKYIAAVVLLPEPVWCGSPPLKLVHAARKYVFYRLPVLKKAKTILVIKRTGEPLPQYASMQCCLSIGLRPTSQ